MGNSYQHLLVAIDDSPISYAAVEHAASLAQDLNATITLMSVVAVDPFVGVDFYKVAPAVTDYFMQAESTAQNRLEEIKSNLYRQGLQVNSKVIRGMPPSEGIIHVADEVGADLIVMGSHGRKGFQRMVLGSVAQNVLAAAPIPVLIVKV
jgi:nucleotide-binding universal stress UspA family protein